MGTCMSDALNARTTKSRKYVDDIEKEIEVIKTKAAVIRKQNEILRVREKLTEIAVPPVNQTCPFVSTSLPAWFTTEYKVDEPMCQRCLDTWRQLRMLKDRADTATQPKEINTTVVLGESVTFLVDTFLLLIRKKEPELYAFYITTLDKASEGIRFTLRILLYVIRVVTGRTPMSDRDLHAAAKPMIQLCNTCDGSGIALLGKTMSGLFVTFKELKGRRPQKELDADMIAWACIGSYALSKLIPILCTCGSCEPETIRRSVDDEMELPRKSRDKSIQSDNDSSNGRRQSFSSVPSPAYNRERIKTHKSSASASATISFNANNNKRDKIHNRTPSTWNVMRQQTIDDHLLVSSNSAKDLNALVAPQQMKVDIQEEDPHLQ